MFTFIWGNDTIWLLYCVQYFSNWLNIPTRWSKKSYINLQPPFCKLKKHDFLSAEEGVIRSKHTMEKACGCRNLAKMFERLANLKDKSMNNYYIDPPKNWFIIFPPVWEESFRKELLRLCCLNWLWGPWTLCIICFTFNQFQFKIDWMSLVQPDIQEWTVWFTLYTVELLIITEIDQLQSLLSNDCWNEEMVELWTICWQLTHLTPSSLETNPRTS